MVTERCQPLRLGPDLCEAQPFGVAGEIFASMLKSMDQGCEQRIEIGNRFSQSRFQQSLHIRSIALDMPWGNRPT